MASQLLVLHMDPGSTRREFSPHASQLQALARPAPQGICFYGHSKTLRASYSYGENSFLLPHKAKEVNLDQPINWKVSVRNRERALEEKTMITGSQDSYREQTDLQQGYQECGPQEAKQVSSGLEIGSGKTQPGGTMQH